MGLHDGPPLCDLGRPPWSGNQLRRLGESIRDGTPAPASGPSYSDVVIWYDDLAAGVQDVLRSLDWESLLTGRQPRITSRSKTIDTLREKLQRSRATPLNNVQDVAGVRFEGDMTLDEQDIVADAIAAAFDHGPDAVHDIRATPHCGYRAVHVWLKLPQGRVEVQVRTLVQGMWANAYEAAADLLGRAIRYGELPSDPEAAQFVRTLQKLSIERAAIFEKERQQLTDESRAMVEVASKVDGSARQSLLRQIERIEQQIHEATSDFVGALAKLELAIRDESGIVSTQSDTKA